MAVVIDPDKQEKIEQLIKSFRELDACIEPYAEQKKELRTEYIEQGWLSKEEFNTVKKAYNFQKRRGNLDDFSAYVEIAKKAMPETE